MLGSILGTPYFGKLPKAPHRRTAHIYARMEETLGVVSVSGYMKYEEVHVRMLQCTVNGKDKEHEIKTTVLCRSEPSSLILSCSMVTVDSWF